MDWVFSRKYKWGDSFNSLLLGCDLMPKKRCKGCGEYHDREIGIQTPAGWFHRIECAREFAMQKATKSRERQAKAITRERKEKLKGRGDYAKEAQTAVNAYIRVRDAGKPCISCGRHHDGQYHAGHYLTVGAHPELRFNTKNIFKQCSVCNNHLSGNLIEYRKALVRLKGEDYMEWLEGSHSPKHYTIEDLIRIKRIFTKKKRMKDKRNARI